MSRTLGTCFDADYGHLAILLSAQGVQVYSAFVLYAHVVRLIGISFECCHECYFKHAVLLSF